MIQTSVISDIVISCLPFFVVVASIFYKVFLLRLPDKQAESLHMFSQYAVQAVEQANQNTGGAQKKTLAVEIIQDFFHEFGLPMPGVRTINTAIENAVYLMNHTSSTEASAQGQSQGSSANEHGTVSAVS